MHTFNGFQNVLFMLHRDMPHGLKVGRGATAASATAREVMEHYGIPVLSEGLLATGVSAVLEQAARDYAAARWSWAIPNEKAIRTLVECSPIVEIGAGTGYWARLAAEAGADVIAYDIRPPRASGMYYPVRRGGQSKVLLHQDRTLFLCWPPHAAPMAGDCLKNYRGDTLIYVGEQYGRTADANFFTMLRTGWKEQRVVEIPRWHGVKDFMFVYRRDAVEARPRRPPSRRHTT